MDYRHDLLIWRYNELNPPPTCRELAEKAGVSHTTVNDTLRDEVKPTFSTISKMFIALGLDPKFALDFKLKKTEFRRAVVDTAR